MCIIRVLLLGGLQLSNIVWFYGRLVLRRTRRDVVSSIDGETS